MNERMATRPEYGLSVKNADMNFSNVKSQRKTGSVLDQHGFDNGILLYYGPKYSCILRKEHCFAAGT